jgi:hypothetical protein
MSNRTMLPKSFGLKLNCPGYLGMPSGYMFTCMAKPIHPQELLAQMGENPKRGDRGPLPIA